MLRAGHHQHHAGKVHRHHGHAVAVAGPAVAPFQPPPQRVEEGVQTLQSALRQAFGRTRADPWFPDVRTLPGAVVMFVFVLYPYVFLLARTARHELVARTLGNRITYMNHRLFLELK